MGKKSKKGGAAKNKQKQTTTPTSETGAPIRALVDYEVPLLEEEEVEELLDEEIVASSSKQSKGIVIATVKSGDKLHFHKILTLDPTTGQPIRILEYNEKENPIQEKLPLVQVTFTFGDYRGRLTATNVKTTGDLSNAETARKVITEAPRLKEMYLSDWYSQAAVGKLIPIVGIIGEKVIYV